MQRALLTAVVTVFWASLYFFVPTLSPYASTLGADLGLVGLVIGSYGATQLALRIPMGWLSDRLGYRKPFVAAGFAITALSCLLMYWAPSAWYLVLGRGLSGLGATMWVLLSVLMASSFPPERAVMAMGLAGFANNIGQVAGTAAGGWVAERWGWGAPFLVSAAVAGAGLLLLMPIREQRQDRSSPITLGVLAEVFASRQLLVVSVLSALMQYLTWVTIFGFTPVYALGVGATRADLGLLTVASLVPQAFTALMAGRLTDRFGAYAPLICGMLVSVATTAAIPYTATVAALAWVQVLGGIGRGLASPLLMALSIRTVPAPRRAMAMGVYQSIYAAGMTLGPVAAGAIGRSTGTQGLFLSTAAVGLIAVVGATLARNTLRVAEGD